MAAETTRPNACCSEMERAITKGSLYLDDCNLTKTREGMQVVRFCPFCGLKVLTK